MANATSTSEVEYPTYNNRSLSDFALLEFSMMSDTFIITNSMIIEYNQFKNNSVQLSSYPKNMYLTIKYVSDTIVKASASSSTTVRSFTIIGYSNRKIY